MMKRQICFLLLISMFGGVLSLHAGENFDQDIRNLAANIAPEKAEQSIKTIREAGTNAFSALLTQFTNRQPARVDFFQRDELATPTIGGVCFDLLQEQIEGNWPKAYRDCHVLKPETAREWLERHAGLSLRQLRVEAAKGSLKRAEQDIKNRGRDWHKEAVSFLGKNLETAILDAKTSESNTNSSAPKAARRTQGTR